MSAIILGSDSQEHFLPPDVSYVIFSYLDGRTIHLISGVCKGWRDLVKSDGDTAKNLWEKIFYRNFVFCGPEEWKEKIGDPGPVPAIDYSQAVKEALIFSSKWPKEWDRKMCFLQPKEILPLEKESFVPLTPRKIGELVAPKLGTECHPTGYRYFWPEALKEHGDKPIKESCWVYMTPDVVPDSRGKAYEVQKKQAKDFGGEVPELVLAITAIFLKYLCSEKRLFGIEPWTYTHCQESTRGLQVVVGGFAPAGLLVGRNYVGGRDNYGVAAPRKF
jgi:hypothetical protein